MKKVIVISIILSLLGAFAIIESSLRQGRCEPILNLGGPNYPLCFTGLLNIPGTFGVIVSAAFYGVGVDLPYATALIGSFLGNFIFYFIAGCIVLFIVKIFKKFSTNKTTINN